MSIINLKVNGRTVSVDIPDASAPLLFILRNDLDLHGPRFGCGLGQCGSCTVIVEGKAVRSCITPVSSVKEKAITTLEGLGSPEKPHPIQQAWIDAQAFQCGFCMNGQIMNAKVLLDAKPHPTDAEIRQSMNGVLCRCGTYYRVRDAIQRAIKLTATANGDSDDKGVA
jgi:nicotinate dehydrogenase subunit A